MTLLGAVITESQVRALSVFVLALSAVGLVAWLLYRRMGPTEPRAGEMTYLEHLEELRVRIARPAILLLLWTSAFVSLRVERAMIGPVPVPVPVPGVFDTVAARVYQWIVAQTLPPGVEVIVLRPAEAFGAQLQVAFVLAVLVTLPFLLFEAWAFLSPGLASAERRFLLRAIPFAIALFFAGAAFAFRLIVPLLIGLLYGFAGSIGATPFIPAGTLVGTVATLVLLFGAAFELPLVMAALSRLGLVRPATFVRKWRHATVAAFVVAAVASDPTLTSQLILGVLLLGLYWSGVVLAHLVKRPAESAASARAAAPSRLP